MNQGKLQAYASWAEVVSALAIVVSLLYAGYEFRRSATMSSREADVILFERERESHVLLIGSPELAEVMILADTAPQSLSAADRLRFLTYQHDFFDTWEMAWEYWADGILDDDLWADWNEWFTREAQSRPSFGWTENRANFTGDAFRKHVDGVLSSG